MLFSEQWIHKLLRQTPSTNSKIDRHPTSGNYTDEKRIENHYFCGIARTTTPGDFRLFADIRGVNVEYAILLLLTIREGVQ